MSTFKMRWPMAAVAAAVVSACGGGGSGGSSAPPAQAQTGNVSVMVSDASSEDWATIGVKILSIALVPPSGSTNVTVYTAPTPAPTLNIAQLDQIAEILAQAPVPAGTYSGAVITLSGNASDVLLTVASDPEAGFAAPGGTTITTGAIQVQNTQGAGSSLTVPVDISFGTPLVVGANGAAALNLEFDLAHPAFLLAHVPVGGGSASWAVDFSGPLRYRAASTLPGIVLRHGYGTVDAVATDNTSITVTKVYPTLPVVSPETSVSSSHSFQVLADATNGTLYYDVDAKTHAVIKDFSTLGSLVGKSVRIAARFQQDGTLVATRIWASSQFSSVWAGPEGHVLHVDSTQNTLAVATESGSAVDLTVDANTQFFFRTPQDGAGDATPIATGTAFLANHDLVRGFKVHASVVDPLATPLVAQSVDIEVAKFDGRISLPSSTDFTYSRLFFTASDDYTRALSYISAGTPNGTDASGAAISGYVWWNFAYPTEIQSGNMAIGNFVAATSDAVNFGGLVGAVPSRGATLAVWNDPANPNGWSAAKTILVPSLVPLGFVTTALTNNAFSMTVLGGAAPGTVSVGTASGSATLVYQVDYSGGKLTISPIDISSSAGLQSFSAGLAIGAPVKVYGTPQADGTLKAYILAYFTGAPPAQ